MRQRGSRRACPGVGAIAQVPAWDDAMDWCPSCGGVYSVRVDGTIGWHPMNWARMVEWAAYIVRWEEVTCGRWVQAWGEVQRRRMVHR